MNTLLIFFALPVATIILAIVVQKILRCTFLTAATFFAIYLIVTFAAFDASFLVYAIAYTIIAFITAFIAEFFFERCEANRRNCCNCRTCRDFCNCNQNAVSQANNNPIAVINSTNGTTTSCNCTNNRPNTVAVNLRDANNASNNSSWCCYRR